MSRARLLIALLVVAPTGCDACSGCEANVVSHVDVPTTLGALEAWAQEDGHTYGVARVERHTGGGACGHSAACVIILPILLADALLPSTLQHGWVTDDDERVLYSGVFDLRGRLIRARVLDGDEYRDIERLGLEQLDEHPIVERARLRLDDEGNVIETRPTALQPQVDLLQMYADALEAEGDPEDRADLVREQLGVLADEGVDAVVERYLSAEPFEDEELAHVLTSLCREPEAWGRAELTGAAVDRGGVRSAIAAVACLPLASDDTARVVPRVVEGVCGDDSLEPALAALATLVERGQRALVLANADTCERETRASLIRITIDEPISDAQWVRALHEDRPLLVLPHLSASAPDGRRILVLALDRERGPTLQIAEELATAEPPGVEEAGRVAAVYVGPISGWSDADVRHHLLRWLARADAPSRAAAASVIAHAGWQGQRHNAAALVLLRHDSRYTPAAMQGSDLRDLRGPVLASSGGTWNEETLVVAALQAAGCTMEQLEGIERASRLSEPVPRCP